MRKNKYIKKIRIQLLNKFKIINKILNVKNNNNILCTIRILIVPTTYKRTMNKLADLFKIPNTLRWRKRNRKMKQELMLLRHIRLHCVKKYKKLGLD